MGVHPVSLLFTILLANERKSRKAFSCPKRGLLHAVPVPLSGKTGVVCTPASQKISGRVLIPLAVSFANNIV
jgi:hypothetical protein